MLARLTPSSIGMADPVVFNEPASKDTSINFVPNA
jgi:hypothetical protein